MQADVDGALRIAHLAEDYDWLWTTENAERFSQLAQFQIDQRHRDLAVLQTALRVEPSAGLLLSKPKVLASAGRPSQSVAQFSVDVTDTGDESSPTLHRSLVDSFGHLSDSFKAEFGPPTRLSPGEYPEIGWDFDEVTILLTTMDNSIALGLVNPVYLRWWGEENEGGDDAEDESDDDEDGDFDDNATDQQSALNSQLTWSGRRDALIAAVTRLPKDVELVLTTPGGSTVAFTMAESKFTSRVECAPDQYGQCDHDWFAANGWNSASDRTVGRWERSVAWPARYYEYEAVVDAAILVLRKPLQVANPNEITVEAF